MDPIHPIIPQQQVIPALGPLPAVTRVTREDRRSDDERRKRKALEERRRRLRSGSDGEDAGDGRPHIDVDA